jgi:Collagen triple helix repeat (20 copies).
MKTILTAVFIATILASGFIIATPFALAADINNPKKVTIEDSDVVINVGGVAGKNGKDGKDGENGKDGIDGKDGFNGTNGKDGINGTNGTDGKDGVNGTNGVDGKDGINGKDGANATATVFINAPNGTEVACVISAPNTVNCDEVPPVVNATE